MNERLEIATIDGQHEVVFQGTSIRVHDVLKLVSAGMSEDAVLAQLPPLRSGDIAVAHNHNREMTRRWAETWAKARPKLERFEREELRAMTDVQRRQALDAVFDLAAHSKAPRKRISGLVEFHRELSKLRP